MAYHRVKHCTFTLRKYGGSGSPPTQVQVGFNRKRETLSHSHQKHLYLFNLQQTPWTGYRGQHIFTNKQTLSVSPRSTHTRLCEIPGIQKTFCIQFLGNIYDCRLKSTAYSQTPLRYMCCIYFLQRASKSSRKKTRKTNLLSVLHWLRCCRLIHLSLHHGSFQALVQVSITIYLKGILTKGFDLGKSIAWMMETIQNPWTNSREQKTLVNLRVCCRHQSKALLARHKLHLAVNSSARASLLIN